MQPYKFPFWIKYDNVIADHMAPQGRFANRPYPILNWAGLYFITICTQNRLCLFGRIINGKMILNEYGMSIKTSWEWLQQQYEHIDPGEFVVMPNHFHGIIVLNNRRGAH